jgi:acid phosphatase type 7
MYFFQKTSLLFCLCFTATSLLLAQKITRGPYLQIGTTTSVVVRWRTDVATIGKVVYGVAPNQKTSSVSDMVPTTEHELKIMGLVPNSVYYYGISAAPNEPLQEGDSYYFKTSAPAGSQQKTRIWALGDAGDGSLNQKAVRDVYLQRIKNNNRETDVVFFLGDNAYPNGTDEEYQNSFFNIYQDYFLKNNVLWSVPGNHEYYSGAQNKRDVAYFQLCSFPQNAEAGGVPSGSEMYYSFDNANVHFVALDSYGIEDKYRLYDTLSPQVEWLKKDLAANRQPWTIVAFHHPPYTKNSHDSDTEAELALIRQNLTPILERFKVDIVLSGHSHLYERSRPMRGHTGLSTTFNENTHLTNTSSGRYDGSPNSCAYIKNGGDEGVIYVVAGSAGRNNGNDGPAHPAMPYKNFLNGGSVVIEVEGNRLNFEWLCNDGVVRDQFTIFKNVNKTTKLKARHGEGVKLTPSWRGSYVWSNGSRQPVLDFVLTNDTTLTVKDETGCLEDRFVVELTEKPVISIDKLPSVLCVGDKLNIPFSVSNTDATKWKYIVQMSDNQGNFGSPITLGTGGSTPFNVTIPNNIIAGEGYRVRVVAQVKGIANATSATFAIRQKPSATLSGNTTIEAGKSASLILNFSGSAPWTYRLSDNSSATTSTNPLLLSVSPLSTTTYSLTAISNACGEGEAKGTARVEVIPRIVANLPTSLVLCNETAFDLPFSVTGAFESSVSYEAQLSDKDGSFSNPRLIGTASQSPIRATIPADAAAGGSYQIRVVPTKNTTANVTATDVFNLKQRAKATISGDTTIQFGEKASLQLRFEGQAPWTYTLSDNTTNTVSTAIHKVNVQPALESIFTLKSVTNVCGGGSVGGSARIRVIITGVQIAGEDVKIFPNPTSSKVIIEVKSVSTQALEWELIDAVGRSLKKGNQKRSLRNQFEINMEELPSNPYFLRIKMGDKTPVYKIIKQ